MRNTQSPTVMEKEETTTTATTTTTTTTTSKTTVETVTIVCISDTHGCHRDLHIPDADILIHAGDFTHFGKEEDVEDFNVWLGELPHKHKIVVNGNHESNAPWKNNITTILSNATHLLNSSIEVPVRDNNTKVNIYGTQFFWPVKHSTSNPYYDIIPDNNSVDVLICHGPVKGMVDDNKGCAVLRSTVERVKPKLVVSGHIHQAYGQCVGVLGGNEVRFVNAANCGGGYRIRHPAMVIELDVPCLEVEE